MSNRGRPWLSGGGGKRVALEPWHYVGNPGEPAFEGDWRNYGGTWTAARFRKSPFGKGSVEGLVAGGAPGTTVFTLPDGYRPPGGLIWGSDQDGNLHARIEVHSGGALVAVSGGAAYLSINCEFDTDTVNAVIAGPARGVALFTGADPPEGAVEGDVWISPGALMQRDAAGEWTQLARLGDPHG